MKNNLFQRIISDNIFLGLNGIDRWDRKRTIKNENVGEHSIDVFFMARTGIEEILPQYAYKEKLEVVTYAGGHDFEENFSGDVNHEVKYNKVNGEEIREALKVFCDAMLKEYFAENRRSHYMWYETTTNPPEYVKDFIKVFDWISAAIFCKREISLGNTTFVKTFEYCTTSLTPACDKSEASMRKLCEKLGYMNESDFSIYNEIRNLNWEL